LPIAALNYLDSQLQVSPAVFRAYVRRPQMRPDCAAMAAGHLDRRLFRPAPPGARRSAS
jgi:hypothetical protein